MSDKKRIKEQRVYLKRYEKMSAERIKQSRQNQRDRLALVKQYESIILESDNPLAEIDLSNPLISFRDRRRLEYLIKQKLQDSDLKLNPKSVDKKVKKDFKNRNRVLSKQIKKAGKGRYRDLALGLVSVNPLLLNSFKEKRDKQRELKKLKGQGQHPLQYWLAVLTPASFIMFYSIFFYVFVLIMVGFISAMMLSHPEAIKELYENGNLGQALWSGNVYEDIVINGQTVVKGNPYARPGCFVYNGVLYCGNCTAGSTSSPPQNQSGCSAAGNSSSAGQGGLTDAAKEWAKSYSALFIGDSLGVGVQPYLEKYFPNLKFNVLSSRHMVGSTGDLNGIKVLEKLVEQGEVGDVLIVALGTNGGLTQEMMEEFYQAIPPTTKKVIYINTGSKGGAGTYGNILYDNISDQIKEFVSSKDNTYYLDWLTFSHQKGWESLTSDSVHLNDEGNRLYADFITQGLYDLENGVAKDGKCQSVSVSTDKEPGAISHDGYQQGILKDFKINAKDPSHVTPEFIAKFLKNGYPNSRLIGLESKIIEYANQYGVSVGVFLGQIATESGIGQVDCGGRFNFGCVRYVEGNEMNWPGVDTAYGKFLDPPNAEEYLKYWFKLIKEVYVDKGAIKYPDYIEKYSPAFENNHVDFEKNMYGVLKEFGYPFKTDESKKPGEASSSPSSGSTPSSSNTSFTCPGNCGLTDRESSDGTGKVKPVESGNAFENESDLTRSDLGYTSDKITAQALDKVIKELAPPSSLYQGKGAVFLKAGLESGYDPRYVLAHAALETGWGTSQILKAKYNSFGIAAYDDTPFDSATTFKSLDDGIIEGAKWIYKNYYGNGQKTLYDMRHDPSGNNHNYATDPEWHVKIAARMKAINDLLDGVSSGGSIQARSEEKPVASCELDGLSLSSPLDMSEEYGAQVNYWFDDVDYRGHKGVDFVYKSDDSGQSLKHSILAAGDGKVIEVNGSCVDFDNESCGAGWGNYVLIEHSNGMRTNYAHLLKGSITVNAGDTVKQGQEIAKMGSSGNSIGVHLHFEVWKGSSTDTRVDPYPYLDWSGFKLYKNKQHPRKNEYTDEQLCKKGTSRPRGLKDNLPASCSPSSSHNSPTSSELVGNSNAEKVYRYFKGLGLSDEAIAGIMGNLMVESGMKPYIIQTRFDLTEDTPIEELDRIDREFGPTGGYQGRGLVQWSHGERWDELTTWAKKHGKGRWELLTQLEYLAREMSLIEDAEVPHEYGVSRIEEGDFPYGIGIKGMDNFKKTKDVEAAVYTFERFERASAAHVDFPRRIQYAKEFLAQFSEWK